jgi:hypothetical protein
MVGWFAGFTVTLKAARVATLVAPSAESSAMLKSCRDNNAAQVIEDCTAVNAIV